MADLPKQFTWSNSSLPNSIALRVGDNVVRSGATAPVVGTIATLTQDQAFVDWRDGSSDWSKHVALRGAPPWWC